MTRHETIIGSQGPQGDSGITTTATTTVAGVVVVDDDIIDPPQALTSAGHLAAADPHPQYALDSEKAAANGIATLDGTTKHVSSQIPFGVLANTVTQGNDSRLSDSRAPSGAASGDLGGAYPSPTVTQARGLRETAGPTTLTLGAVADGEFLKRSGATVVGATSAAADPTQGSYAPGSFTIATGKYAIMSRRLTMTGTQRLTGQGTGCLRVT